MKIETKRLPDISIIATFHNEGIIAYKTIKNILQLMSPFQQQNIPYEIILHIDDGDKDTIKCLESFKDITNIKIFKNSFGNPSDSRNFCVRQAKGEYIAFLDGDDIVSDNWIIDGYKILKASKKEQILHVETNITFGVDNVEEQRIWHMSDSYSKPEDTALMFTRNRWEAGAIMRRQLALKFPYNKTCQGFGYEDWVFNMDTRNANILHKVVPNSVKFYRAHSGSIYNLHGADNAVTAYSAMFSTSNMQKLAKSFDNGEISIKTPSIKERFMLRVLKHISTITNKVVIRLPHINKIAQRITNYNDRRRGQKTFKKLPSYIQEAWFKANQIDSEIWPDPLKLSKLWYYNSNYNDLTLLYCRIISQIRKDPDYLFLPPRLAIGGTEKVIVNYLNAFAKLHPDWHIVVLGTLPAKHPYKIPKNVDFVDFYGIMDGHTPFEIDFILSRFIIQTKVKRLHIIHNEIAFAWAKAHLNLLCNNDFLVYVSQFMYEFNFNPDLKVGFIDPYIRDIYPAITKVLTDNQYIADEMINLNGFSKNKVSVNYQPINTLKTKEDTKPHKPFRILWASRVSYQKRPDILRNIAKKLNPDQYRIDIYGRCQRPYSKKYFKSVDNVITYKGTYSGIESLDISQYDAFLYTSQTDGLPNILLEIASAGLPIVASNVGGVGNIIKSDTGYPVKMEDINEYIVALNEIRDDPHAAFAKAKKAQQIVLSRHSWSHFLKQVKKDIK